MLNPKGNNSDLVNLGSFQGAAYTQLKELIIMTKPQLPSLGDITKALFDHAGVLPQKNDNSDVVGDEKTKKKIQTQLRRLAREESELEKNLIDLLSLLKKFINEATGDVKVTYACMASIDDVFNQYLDLVRGDATFLSKPGSIKWLIKTKLLDRIVLSSQKNPLKFNVAASNLLHPADNFWWLPDIKEQSVKWPVAKVMEWMYSICDINQTHFHFPDFGEIDDYRLSQNLENASRWANGKNLPSWASLLKNINDSLSAMTKSRSPQYRRVINNKTQSNFKTILFIARFSTSVFIELERQFGRDYVVDIVGYLKRQDRRLNQVHDNFRTELLSDIRASKIENKQHLDLIWLEQTKLFWELRSEYLVHSVKSIELRFNEKYNHGFTRDDIKFFLQRMGAFHLAPLLEEAQKDVLKIAPASFFELYFNGLKLRQDANCTAEKIAQYVENVNNAQLETHLSWIIGWLWATYHYRREEDALALPYYSNAFEDAKYCAGGNQYLLVNQYIECCAKNELWRDFKKGIAWANYLGIKIRWYRGVDESDDPLKTAYLMLKIARYAKL